MVKHGKADLETLKGYFTTVVLIIAGGFFFHDIFTDISKGYESATHTAIEAVIFAVVMMALWFEIRRAIRSEELRVGKEVSSRWSPSH